MFVDNPFDDISDLLINRFNFDSTKGIIFALYLVNFNKDIK